MEQIPKYTAPPVKRMPSPVRSRLSRLYAKITYALGAWQAVYAVRRLTKSKPRLAVFTFHRISDSESLERHLVTYDMGTPQEVFKRQIVGIKKFYQVLTLEQFIEVVSGKRELPRHAALLTFDDADSEFGSAALPVLQKHSCPSVVFVPTDFVDSSKRFWHLRVSNAFHKLEELSWAKVQELTRQFPLGRSNWLDDLDSRSREDLKTACWRFNLALDQMSEEEIESYVGKLEAITGGEYALGIETMSWNAIRNAAQHGVHFESHSASHHKLARVGSGNVRQELESSKAVLEKQLGKTVTAVCYPGGSFDENVLRLTGESGYKVGFTNSPGFVDYPVSGNDLFALPRFDMRGNDKYEVARFLGELLLRRFRKRWPLK